MEHMKENETIKGVKGFNKDMTCRGFQYEEGKEYDTTRAKACSEGFHFCENPIDVLSYYNTSNSVYHLVEGSGDIDKGTDDSKVACTHIKIGARLTIAQICKMTFDYVRSKCTNENNAEPGKPATAGNRGAATAGECGAATAGYSGAATAGECGAATAGNRGAATAGYRGAATAGECGAATAGNRGAATAGYSGAATAGECGAATAGNRGAATAGYRGAATAGECGAATAGECGAATAGECGAATAGYRGAATAGDSGVATSRGSVKVGADGVGLVRGDNVKICGGLGAVLFIANEEDTSYAIKEWKAFVVDGDKVKANTWYKLVDGELEEAQD